MEYFILEENDRQSGPFSVEQLKSKRISPSTKVRCQGMENWSEAGTIEELKELFFTSSATNIPPPVPTVTKPDLSHSNGSQTWTRNIVYEDFFTVDKLTPQEIEEFKKNHFFSTFNTAVGILLHFLTIGIFTTIYCGLKHSKLPKINYDDFDAGKAIGFLFIPFFNIYWLFVFWRRLAMRINLQFKLRNERPPVSLGLATAVCILTLIPCFTAINFFILIPILFSQIQSATNKLAKENLSKIKETNEQG